MTYKNIKLVKYIGGGRWARTVLLELVQNFNIERIDWFCSYNYAQNQSLLKDFGIKNISLKNNLKDVDYDYEKIIISSHSLSHKKDYLDNTKKNIPVNIEKPLFSSYKEYIDLSNYQKNNSHFNLEFFNAYFIRDFSERINWGLLDSLEIIWHDPFIERRGKEVKYSEGFSSIFMDQLLHVLSIVKSMGIKTGEFIIKDIKFSTDNSERAIEIISNNKRFEIKFSLSRFYKIRERKIIINNGEMTLDFSKNPIIKRSDGHLIHIDQRERQRPIAQTLNNFITCDENYIQNELSFNSLMPEIEFCFNSENLFLKIIRDRLNKNGINNLNDKLGIPLSSYFSSIIYYRQSINSAQMPIIHYSNGIDGLKKLLKWSLSDFAKSAFLDI